MQKEGKNRDLIFLTNFQKFSIRFFKPIGFRKNLIELTVINSDGCYTG